MKATQNQLDREKVRELERRLKVSLDIQTAEKKILIDEIAAHAKTKGLLNTLFQTSLKQDNVGNQVMLKLGKAEKRLAVLEQFFKEVSILTLKHDVLSDSAVVYPSKLCPVLEKVDPEWWRYSGKVLRK